MRLIIDASVTGAWILPDEQSETARNVRLRLEDDTSIVPAHWWFEVRNLLLMAERKGRIDPAGTERASALLRRFPIEVDGMPQEPALLDLARRHRLTIYDAAYLELALRLGEPLATLDRGLAEAATAEGVTMIR